MRNNKRALYESIMRDVAKIVKKTINESENNDNHILVTYHFSDNNSENCYNNPAADINHSQLASKAFDIMDKYAAFMELDEKNNMKKIYNSFKSSLEIGWEFITASPFDNIDNLINDLEKLNKDNAFIEIKIGNYYKTN